MVETDLPDALEGSYWCQATGVPSPFPLAFADTHLLDG